MNKRLYTWVSELLKPRQQWLSCLNIIETKRPDSSSCSVIHQPWCLNWSLALWPLDNSTVKLPFVLPLILVWKELHLNNEHFISPLHSHLTWKMFLKHSGTNEKKEDTFDHHSMIKSSAVIKVSNKKNPLTQAVLKMLHSTLILCRLRF